MTGASRADIVENMSTEKRTWGFRPLSIEGRLLLGALLAVICALYVAGFLQSHDWSVLVLPVVLVVTQITSRAPRRIEIEGQSVTFVLSIRKVQVPASDIHRLRRTRLVGNVKVETSAGNFVIPFWLKGLQEMALHMWALNPALVIEGP